KGSPFGLVELRNERLRRRRATDVATDDGRDMLLLPAHDLSDNSLRDASGVEPRRGGASKIVKMQVAIMYAGCRLRSRERRAEPVRGPGTVQAVGEDSRRAFRDPSQHLLELAIERNDGLASTPGLTGRHDDRVLADVRPRERQQITEPEAGSCRQSDGVCDLWQARRLQHGDIGSRPNDLAAIFAVELLDTFAWVAGDLAELDGVRQHAR